MKRTWRSQIPGAGSTICTQPAESLKLLLATAEEAEEGIRLGDARPSGWLPLAGPDGETGRGILFLIGGVIGLTVGLASFLLTLCKSWEVVPRLPWELSPVIPRAYARAAILVLALVGLALNSLVQTRALRHQVRMGVRGLHHGGKGLTEKGAAASWLGKILCIYGVMLWAVYFLMTIWAGD